jgi:hypothetical protein
MKAVISKMEGIVDSVPKREELRLNKNKKCAVNAGNQSDSYVKGICVLVI